MLNDKGDIKNSIFVLSMVISLVMMIAVAVGINELDRLRKEKEQLQQQIEIQSILIEYLGGDK